VTDSGMTIAWTTKSSVAAYTSFQVEAFEAFNNPKTSEETSFFELKIFTDSTLSTVID
jgi:hypothetical protein